MEGLENVDETISEKLGQISVSKKDYEKFQLELSEQMVEKWEESSYAKVFRGVKIDNYHKFLDNFQESTLGITDEIKFDLKQLGDTVDDLVDDSVDDSVDDV